MTTLLLCLTYRLADVPSSDLIPLIGTFFPETDLPQNATWPDSAVLGDFDEKFFQAPAEKMLPTPASAAFS